jgi:hypothetical protein
MDKSIAKQGGEGPNWRGGGTSTMTITDDHGR